ncbi:MAG: phospholipase D-like domain-containing protein [Deltaproteobacteria bacterium]|nr:phospholipase D-like domain-containing protein [Deltaproteobacteria bacterium]
MKKKKASLIRRGSPWKEGNHFSLLVNGPVFFTAMLDAVREAREYILLEMYLMESGDITTRFINELVKAAERGVKVYLLIDDFGSWKLGHADRQRINKSKIEMAFFNPLRYWKWRFNLHRNHRKLLVIDGKTAFTGGAGLTDEFSANDGKSTYWRETMVQIRGPVTKDWARSFLNLWKRWSKREASLSPAKNHGTAGIMQGKVAFFDRRKRHATIRSLISRVRTSKKRVWIMTAYFIPTWKIRRTLAKAARKGIDVRIILPGSRTDHPSVRRISQTYYFKLLKSGVKIYEYEPSFLHSKVMLCDNWVSIGSTNLDRWSLRWNMEANQEVRDNDFAHQVMEMFNDDFQNCTQIDLTSWVKRPWSQRIIEYFWEQVMVWSEYFIYTERVKVLKKSKRELLD